MEKFQLHLFLQIIGIGAASGLVYKDNSLYVIGDNSGYLYEYPLDSKQLKRHALIDNPLENTPKKDKSDLEALALSGEYFFAFGSGSTDRRNKMIEVNSVSKMASATLDLSDLYLSMQSFGSIKPEDFNIEGAVFTESSWYLFNRGNGKSKKNTIFTINGDLKNEFTILSNNYKLPKINKTPSSFTDAVAVGDKIYFLATAEDTQSTYHDGEVKGSLIGRLDINSMKIDFTKKISDTHKFEGITLYKQTSETLEFLLCEDKDSDVQQSDIYLLSVPKK